MRRVKRHKGKMEVCNFLEIKNSSGKTQELDFA
jgi:hypothetical protein